MNQTPPQASPRAPRVHGHFGEWIQGVLGPDGPVALISVPCPALWVEGRQADTPPDSPNPLDPDCARRLCAALSLPCPDPLPAMVATMPLGGGAGSSTAALVSLARSLRSDATPSMLARACARAEGASDPLMLDHADQLLFAPRRGEVLKTLPPLPAFSLIGGFWGASQRTDPRDSRFADIADLVAAWETTRDLPGFAALATESAQRCLALRGPDGDPSLALCERLGALGMVLAHTGSARGFIFARGGVPDAAHRLLSDAGFAQIIRFDGGHEGPRAGSGS